MALSGKDISLRASVKHIYVLAFLFLLQMFLLPAPLTHIVSFSLVLFSQFPLGLATYFRKNGNVNFLSHFLCQSLQSVTHCSAVLVAVVVISSVNSEQPLVIYNEVNLVFNSDSRGPYK